MSMNTDNVSISFISEGTTLASEGTGREGRGQAGLHRRLQVRRVVGTGSGSEGALQGGEKAAETDAALGLV